jgi:D-alanyl-lipoteichoic acid acyltransferase DltB (MBOAT superfamily)
VGGAKTLFTSFAFVALYTITLLGAAFTRGRTRLYLLLVASYAFCAYAGLTSLLILVSVTLLSFWGGKHLSANPKRWHLGAYVAAVLAFLVAFKYLNVGSQAIAALAESSTPWSLPLWPDKHISQ